MRGHLFHFARQNLSSWVFCSICLLGMPAVSSAQEVIATGSPEQQQSDFHSAKQTSHQASKEVKAALHQELKTLLDENLSINKEKKALLESAEQKTFWIQCLVFFLTAIMIVTLISFWRFHAQRIFRRSLDDITTSLKTFQDSIISFIDTTQLTTATTVSSFHAQVAPAAAPRMVSEVVPETKSIQKKHPSDFIPPDEVTNTTKGFFDAWLRVYKPGEDYVKQTEIALKNKPQSPEVWLQMMQNFRKTDDYFHFESLRTEIKKFFNIKIDSWHETDSAEAHSIADYPHVQQKIFDAWPDTGIVTVLERLLLNSRLSAREGFDQALYQKLEDLLILAKDPQRPLRAVELKEHPVAAFLFAAPTRTLQEAAKPLRQHDKLNSQTPLQAPITTDNATLAKVAPTASPTSNKTLHDVASNASVKHASPAKSNTEQKLDEASSENKNLQSACEVRFKLALAYLDIGDTEGACLLLEDVINDAPQDQQRHARQLLSEIEVKRSKSKEIWIA